MSDRNKNFNLESIVLNFKLKKNQIILILSESVL